MELEYVLQSPVVTEKSTNAQKVHQYTFRIHPAATKIDVARAVERYYGVPVLGVTTRRVQPKVRMAGRGRSITKRKASKIAVVTVSPKHSIDFNKVKIK